METALPSREVIAEVQAAGGGVFRLCYQCGKCDVVCPWNHVRTFSMRRIIREAGLGMPEIESEDLWLCTTCGTCTEACPRGVKQIELGVALRRIATEYGVFPAAVRAVPGVASSLRADGNPLSEDRGKRADWAAGLGVRPFTEGMEVLYFVGCYPSYDPRLKKVAVATARILEQAGVDFGILGTRENCCGESIRKAGNEEVYRTLARENIKTFIDHGVRRILVSSPHCYETFKKEYPEFMVHFEVVHIAPYLNTLLEEGRLRIAGTYGKKVAYHDPCYLGRHNGIYDEPRAVLGRIAGLELVEMVDCREHSLCCGGGGGGIWKDTPMSERLSNLRVKQAREAGAAVLATSCPYCITNFEESRLTLDYADVLEIKDIVEIVHEALL
ncbi:MAG: (Fe-S)-binding protein [Planctomycetes bacterium]|nr:(Fe-S)-binding protein [Planctomycetota bacterium]